MPDRTLLAGDDGMSENRVLLLVEDDPLVGMATQGLLEDLGYDVLGPAADAPEALAIVDGERPDLVLTDINLRRHGDGLELAAELHNRLGLFSLFLSGDAPEASILERTYTAGYLQKPYNRAKLGDAVQAALSRIGAVRA
jgi:two-component system, response regulator PdtaR